MYLKWFRALDLQDRIRVEALVEALKTDNPAAEVTENRQPRPNFGTLLPFPKKTA